MTWYIYRLLAGLATLLIGFGAGILIRRITQKVLRNINLNKTAVRVGLTWNLEKGISALLSFIAYALTIFIFLNQLQITSVVIYLAVLGIVILISLSLLVAIKDVLPNFWAWFLLRHQIKIGQKVAGWDKIRGVIIQSGCLETRLRTPRGDILYVLNYLLLKFMRPVTFLHSLKR